jgi:hypothetical protein
MRNINDLPILEQESVRVGKITRRDAARRLLAGIAAGAALPFGAATHPIWKHFEDEHLMGRAEGVAAAAKLQFLSPEQSASLTAVAEAIVPGSTKADVASFIDLLLSADNKKSQKEFVSSLERMEAESRTQYGMTFSALQSKDKNEIMASASATVHLVEKDDEKFREAFKNLKEWISGAYYSSEIGMRELGWTPDRVFAEFPGCSHAEGHD